MTLRTRIIFKKAVLGVHFINRKLCGIPFLALGAYYSRREPKLFQLGKLLETFYQ